jgi:hypothetical protein
MHNREEYIIPCSVEEVVSTMLMELDEAMMAAVVVGDTKNNCENCHENANITTETRKPITPLQLRSKEKS